MIHLHVHTSGSVLDGACDIKRLVTRAKELGMPAIGISDHGNMIKTLEFQKECIEQGIKPIIGCEFYIGEPGTKDVFHILCIAKNNKGLKNLYKLNTYSYLKNFYSKPRISLEKLQEHKEGLIVTTGCMGSEWGKLLPKHEDLAKENLETYRAMFGDDFYVEIQSNSIPEQKIYNTKMVEFATILGIPVVVTSDVHYVKKEDAEAHDVLLCMQVKKKVQDENRFRFNCDDFYLKSESEIYSELVSMGLEPSLVESAIRNTHRIADKCSALIKTGMHLLPKYSEDENYQLALRCNEGYKKRYGKYNKEIVERVQYELDVIRQKGYAGYFLIVEDFINYAKKNNILVGPGRGSAAGSVVAYLLGITNVDPIKHGLLFERFLNPERSSIPDIDSDFDYEHRDRVVAYVKEKYGHDRVANIIAEGTLAPKAVVRKFLSAFDYETRYINRVCKTLDDKKIKNLDEAYATIPEFKEHIDHIGIDKFNMMKTLEGLMSYVGKHAAGIVICNRPIDDVVPCMRDSDTGDLMTQWHKDLLEEVGVYKFDFLGLKTLTILRKTIEQIKKNHGIEINLDEIDLNDPGIYSVLNSLDLCGIFQFDAPAGKQTIERIKPTCFEDIVAAEALCRPGVKEAELYFENRDDLTYESAIVEDILSPTRGAIVYQEQTMLLMNKLAGWSLGKADKMRKVKDLEEYREEFVEGCLRNHYSREFANKIYSRFDLGYSFNKSHAVSYAIISAICAWLKYYYRKEFMAATMTLEVSGDSNKLMEQMRECGKYDINIVLPDVRTSRFDFVTNDNNILLPLTSIKNVGAKAVDSIASMYQNGEVYSTFEDFYNASDKRVLNKRAMINLIKGGAFSHYSQNRNMLIRKYMELRNEEVPVLQTWSREVQMKYEAEVIGMTISCHPLDGYQIPEFATVPDGETTTMGIVKRFRQIKDKNNNDMAFVTIENKTDTIEAILFQHVYSKYRPLLYDGAILRVRGRKDKGKLLVNEIQLVS